MEEEKIKKQKSNTLFNRRNLLLKILRGNMTTAKKNVKIFILQRKNMTKGEYGKGYYGIYINGINVYSND